MKIDFISDTHSRHEFIEQGEGDLLIHAGDLTSHGDLAETNLALNWLAKQKKYYSEVVFIGGNHDFYLQQQPALCKELSKEMGLHYLENDGINTLGLNIWGSPVTPLYGYMAFNLERGYSLRRIWERMPMETDIVVTHCPPMYIRDQVMRGDGKMIHTGCEDLANHILHRKPLIHCFGHIHEGYGVTNFNGIHYLNASVLDECYNIKNKAITALLEKQDNKWQLNNIQEGLIS